MRQGVFDGTKWPGEGGEHHVAGRYLDSVCEKKGILTSIMVLHALVRRNVDEQLRELARHKVVRLPNEVEGGRGVAGAVDGVEARVLEAVAAGGEAEFAEGK